MGITIDRLMTSAVIAAAEDDTLGEVRERMAAHDIGALPVVNAHGVLVGIVTSEDLGADYEATLPVSRVMTSPVHTLPPGADAADAARTMRERRQHHVVVVEGQEIVGMLSAFDLLRLVETGVGRPER